MTDGSAHSDAIVVLGKIVDAYGLHGAVRVHPFADDPARWAKMPQWWIGDDEAATAWTPVGVRRCKLHDAVLVAELEGVPDRTAAEALRGRLIAAPRDALPQPAENEYYWGDLVGLTVVNTRDEVLGEVLGLIETPANDVLRVSNGDAPERLLPFVAAVVLDVDLAARRVRVDWAADW